MKYPDWLYGYDSFMKMPKSYQEYFVRWYYYVNTDETKIPDTIPVEHIEDFIAENVMGVHLWCAKGFAAARNVDEGKGNNIHFQNDAQFLMVVHFCAKMIYKMGVENNWFKPNISEKKFEKYLSDYRDFDMGL